jgi:hypothetical protein
MMFHGLFHGHQPPETAHHRVENQKKAFLCKNNALGVLHAKRGYVLLDESKGTSTTEHDMNFNNTKDGFAVTDDESPVFVWLTRATRIEMTRGPVTAPADLNDGEALEDFQDWTAQGWMPVAKSVEFFKIVVFHRESERMFCGEVEGTDGEALASAADIARRITTRRKPSFMTLMNP